MAEECGCDFVLEQDGLVSGEDIENINWRDTPLLRLRWDGVRLRIWC